jgi:hypothetical protein
MSRPNFYITEENFADIVGSGLWAIQDVPPERAEALRAFLNNPDSLAVFASGIAPRQVDRSDTTAVGGIDWVRLEPVRRPGEPPLNVYHFIIGHRDEIGYPVRGPFREGAIAPHYSTLEDLEVY